MKSFSTLFYVSCVAASLTVLRADDSAPAKEKARERKRPALTEEQKTARKELLAKYDSNKDGKLDREERAKITSEDKARLQKNTPNARPRKNQKKN